MTVVAEPPIQRIQPVQRLDGLVALARRDDARALDELLLELRPLIYRWAWIRTADADEAEDVTQNVLMRVHSGIQGFDGRSSITTWLYRVTSNAAAEMQRKRTTWQRLRDRWSTQRDTDETSHDALDGIADRRAVEIVRMMMSKLSTNQRAALDLVDLQGYEPIEAARMLDMNPATLRTHLLRGRKTIRGAILKEEA